MKKILFALLLSFAGLAFGADCDYLFGVDNVTLLIGEGEQVIQQNLSVTRTTNSSDGRCRTYRVFFGKGLANSYQRKAYSFGGKAYNYNLHSALNKNGVLKEFGDAVNANEFIQGSAPGRNTTYNSKFYVAAPGYEDNAVSSGTFYDVVQVSIYGYNESNGSYTFEETQNLTLIFIVSKKIEVSLIDENGTFDPNSTTKVLDFGNITQGTEKGADLRIVSNTPYQVRMSSMNNGVMRLNSSSSIAYALKVNGATTGLGTSAGSPVAIGSGWATGPAGDRYNLKVQITGSTANLPAGLYQDAITITAVAN